MNIQQCELYFYTLQQNTNNFLFEQLNHITLLSFLTIFFGGILTSFNPCMISSIPLAIVAINKKSQLNLLSIFFILGLLTSLLIISCLAMIARTTYSFLQYSFPFFQPLLIIAIGFSILNLININLPFYPQNRRLNQSILSLIEIYIIGISIGINISPCATPILMTVFIWITTTNNIGTGILFLLIYTSGYLIPIIVSIISIHQFIELKSVNLFFSFIIPFSGCIIISLGSFSLFHILLKSSII